MHFPLDLLAGLVRALVPAQNAADRGPIGSRRRIETVAAALALRFRYAVAVLSDQ
jgi:hypothetical protein